MSDPYDEIRKGASVDRAFRGPDAPEWVRREAEENARRQRQFDDDMRAHVERERLAQDEIRRQSDNVAAMLRGASAAEQSLAMLKNISARLHRLEEALRAQGDRPSSQSDTPR